MGVNADPLTRVRRAVWGMLYADDGGIASKSTEGLAKMRTVIVTVFEAAALTVSEKKTETMLPRTPDQAPGPHRSPSRQQARGVDRQRSFYIWAVLSTQAPTLCQK